MLSHSQVSFVFGVQQVPHTFTVNLHIAHLKQQQPSWHTEYRKELFKAQLYWDICIQKSFYRKKLLKKKKNHRNNTEKEAMWVSFYLYRVRHAVVSIAVIYLGKKIFTQLLREKYIRVKGWVLRHIYLIFSDTQWIFVHMLICCLPPNLTLFDFTLFMPYACFTWKYVESLCYCFMSKSVSNNRLLY